MIIKIVIQGKLWFLTKLMYTLKTIFDLFYFTGFYFTGFVFAGQLIIISVPNLTWNDNCNIKY